MRAFWRSSAVRVSLAILIVVSSFAAYFQSQQQFYYEPPGKSSSPLCGITAVASMLALHGIDSDLGTIYQYANLDTDGTSLKGCLRALEYSGLNCRGVRYRTVWDLPAHGPAICVVRTRAGLHAVVGIRDGDRVVIVDGPHIQSVFGSEFDRFGIGVAILAKDPPLSSGHLSQGLAVR